MLKWTNKKDYSGNSLGEYFELLCLPGLIAVGYIMIIIINVFEKQFQAISAALQ